MNPSGPTPEWKSTDVNSSKVRSGFVISFCGHSRPYPAARWEAPSTRNRLVTRR